MTILVGHVAARAIKPHLGNNPAVIGTISHSEVCRGETNSTIDYCYANALPLQVGGRIPKPGSARSPGVEARQVRHIYTGSGAWGDCLNGRCVKGYPPYFG